MSPTSSPTIPSQHRKTKVIHLIAFWILTLAAVIVALVWSVANLNYGSASSPWQAWAIAYLIASIITICLTIYSAIYRARPIRILIPNASLFILWAVILACSFLVPPKMVGLFQLSAEAVLILTSGGQTIYGFVFYRRARRIDAEVKAIDQAPPKAMSVGAGEDGVVAEGPRSELSSYGWSLSDRRSLTLPYSASIQYSTSVHYSSSLGSSFEQPPPRYDEGDMAIRLEMIR